jgi:hypothetical protein
MATSPNSMKPSGPAPIMKPEGSRKICVMNGSRQVDQVIKGAWETQKVLPENGLPKGIYQLADAAKPDTGKDGKQKEYTGQLLHVDSRDVYQLQGKGIVKHDRAVFNDLESKGDTLTVGKNYAVEYANGKGAAKAVGASSAQAQAQAQPKRTASKDTGHGM